MDGNPNMIDSLFTPRRCVLHTSPLGEKVRENRKLFLSKKVWHTFKGYAYAQMRKCQSKEKTGKRSEIIQKYGYDIKNGYHIVRLIEEVQQILEESDLNLERNINQLKSIRRGEWSIEKIIKYFNTKEFELESLYAKSNLPHKPRKSEIKNLLIECLNYALDGVEENIIIPKNSAIKALKDIQSIIDEALKD